MSEIALTRAFAPRHFQANPLRTEREFGGVVKMARGIVVLLVVRPIENLVEFSVEMS
ncbi:hypothetical protein DENSPDRAFT_845886, partial [Dentipellis sp. KUC8613]